ncbi:uncharacterized protein LY89DRAFT_687184 [Mollisia scopiformis]|uniref:Uncharacterized protein n=1 Tax=Mollisia scopiformis TaxID=149040 RepID=A0A194X0V5_MOLSC|nr:uncharacterized protein LY89DRAFT_687184 [Mollisia scopiformis]KUJ13831.1 hypothetical protein LY89DRAFT_687184 [Mollisia scopiformis]
MDERSKTSTNEKHKLNETEPKSPLPVLERSPPSNVQCIPVIKYHSLGSFPHRN